MPEVPAAGRARRGMQKQLSAIFDGVWIPKPHGSSRPVGVPNLSSIEST